MLLFRFIQWGPDHFDKKHIVCKMGQYTDLFPTDLPPPFLQIELIDLLLKGRFILWIASIEEVLSCNVFRGAGMAQWWEHSLSTNVARVRFPDSTSYVGWVCCWFSSLLREVFLRVLRFSPVLKNQHFKFHFDLERTDTFKRVYMNSSVLRG